jgi:alkanesulfonate monooxygenase SsuD/methylene tetrahydromethanopterin reductase-like flavin-dependent oxidoreductase (luciferase family)
LLRSDQPATYSGRFFQLREARLLPRPQRLGGPSITIGGNGPKRTLPLVARYADIWKAVFVGPDQFRALNATLDGLLRDAGRAVDSVKRTAMTGLFFGRDQAALKIWLDRLRERRPETAGKSDDEIVASMRDEGHVVIGLPEQVRVQIDAYARAGVAELMLQWLDMDDIDGLRAFAEVIRSR